MRTQAPPSQKRPSNDNKLFPQRREHRLTKNTRGRGTEELCANTQSQYRLEELPGAMSNTTNDEQNNS
jgi:hypothetical protein